MTQHQGQRPTTQRPLLWLRALLIGLLVTSGLVFVSAGPAQAGTTTLCSGNSFSTCIDAGYTAHGYETHYMDNVSGTGVGYWKAFNGHNCTNYVGYMLTQNGDAGHGVAMGVAKDWDNTINNNPSWGYAMNGMPAVGSIAQWEANAGPATSSGHVGYVEAVTQAGSVTTITVSWDNYDSGPFSWKTITSDSSNWPSRFLHIKDTAATTPPPVYTQLQWYDRNSNSSGDVDATFLYGNPNTDTPVFGDWDGNGSTTIGVVRNASGNLQWILRDANSGGSAGYDFSFGNAGTDRPIFGDWDGNGTTTVGIVRNVNGSWQWMLRDANNSGSAGYDFSFGNAGIDTPVFGDWDGNGTVTPGLVRNTNGSLEWLLRNSNSGGSVDVDYAYGNAGTDTPIFGDWDGSGTTTPGVVRSTPGVGWEWILRDANSGGSAGYDFDFGNPALDVPAFGDWDGNGTTTPGLVRKIQ